MFFEQNQKHFVIQMVYRKKGVCMRFILCLLLLVLIMPGAFAFGKSAKTTDFCTQVQQTDSKYTFEDNGDKTLSGKVVKLKKGTVLPITLQTPIDTSVIQENDEVTATLNEDLKIDGAVVAKQNSVFYGRVVKAKSASNCMRGGKVKINFDKLVTTDEKTYVIETKPIDFVVSSEDKMMTIGQTPCGATPRAHPEPSTMPSMPWQRCCKTRNSQSSMDWRNGALRTFPHPWKSCKRVMWFCLTTSSTYASRPRKRWAAVRRITRRCNTHPRRLRTLRPCVT